MTTPTIEGVQLLTAADGEAYDDARRVFNAMFDRRPRAIARVKTPHDVAAAIGYARGRALPIAVRAGGHSVAGYSSVEDGLVIDVRPIDHIAVHIDNRTVRVGAGVTWGALDAATQAHGLATTGGRMTTTGVAGFTLGSGSGWLERMHGLACDNLLSAHVVTADGQQLIASETQNPDLFWGLRGGGGNFGVVTEFTFRLHAVGPTIYGGFTMHPRVEAPKVVRLFRDFMDDAPREVCGGAILMTAPPAPFVPADLRGRPAVSLFAAYFGPVDEGERALAPLRTFSPPAVDNLGARPYVEFQAMTDPGNPPGRRNYWRSGFLSDLPDDAIDTFLACGVGATSPYSVQVLARAGGAISDTPEDATPISGRSAPWLFHCYGSWEQPDDDRHIAWVRTTEQAMRPWSMPGMALNFFSAVDPELIRSTFGAGKYARLTALKAKYDPENLFHLNQNIPPAPTQ
ncbi:FAD-binding oxidoreductase [Jiangella aurantiaca]|uniref:FAD-binding oxidoreductase n=1 Tax=Jiangella aurantiaca TaxID=2530373 RepID=A0A4R5ALC2_9ACTN|nr:FAD-binding oxidoreductase [Jiangella aurantiaca]TDD72685.1 FAD-binding oxidoreductase [Jiangella aurantiaca]